MLYYIYKICCDDYPDYVYVGSTQNITKRKCRHKTTCNNKNNKYYNIKLYTTIRENGGWDNWRMVCIDEIHVENRRQAEMKEEEWRAKLSANLNMIKAFRTEQENKDIKIKYREEHKTELKEYQKEYRKKHKDNLKEKEKEYYNENKDKLLEKKKEYYKTNKDKLLEKKKENYETNKDKIQEKRKEKIVCDCGVEITKGCLTRHKKSKKHLDLLAKIK